MKLTLDKFGAPLKTRRVTARVSLKRFRVENNENEQSVRIALKHYVDRLSQKISRGFALANPQAERCLKASCEP